MSNEYSDFTEKNIEERNRKIVDEFINYLSENNLIEK
jgi:hypothetical protein